MTASMFEIEPYSFLAWILAERLKDHVIRELVAEHLGVEDPNLAVDAAIIECSRRDIHPPDGCACCWALFEIQRRETT